jgi:hypothetical protein
MTVRLHFYLTLCFLCLTTSTSSLTAPPSSRFRPYDAIEEIEPILARVRASVPGSLPASDIAALWSRAGDVYDAARNYSASLSARIEAEATALSAVTTTPSSKEAIRALMLSRVALVESFRAMRRFKDAKKILAKARASAGTAPAAASVVAALWRAEARIERCAGGGIHHGKKAIEAWNRGAPGGVGSAWPIAPLKSQSDIQLALDLWITLGSVVGEEQEKEIDISSTASTVDESRRGRIAAALIETGPWQLPTQLPRTYTPDLLARPWHDIDTLPNNDAWQTVKRFADMLHKAAPALVAEWKALPPSMRLRESECLSDAKRGEWTYATVNAPWVKDVDDDGCATSTPIACALLREARSQGMSGTALRGTYSSLAGGARLTRHCGMTNAQIKLHVGLIIPTISSTDGLEHSITATATAAVDKNDADATADAAARDDRPCAALTVNGVTQAWRAGEVLIFDDSFEHSVESHCVGERTIFQFVIPHPDLPLNERSNIIGSTTSLAD